MLATWDNATPSPSATGIMHLAWDPLSTSSKGSASSGRLSATAPMPALPSVPESTARVHQI
eukprot:1992631-Pyramimonas_sp.AAC.1